MCVVMSFVMCVIERYIACGSNDHYMRFCWYILVYVYHYFIHYDLFIFCLPWWLCYTPGYGLLLMHKACTVLQFPFIFSVSYVYTTFLFASVVGGFTSSVYRLDSNVFYSVPYHCLPLFFNSIVLIILSPPLPQIGRTRPQTWSCQSPQSALSGSPGFQETTTTAPFWVMPHPGLFKTKTMHFASDFDQSSSLPQGHAIPCFQLSLL